MTTKLCIILALCLPVIAQDLNPRVFMSGAQMTAQQFVTGNMGSIMNNTLDPSGATAYGFPTKGLAEESGMWGADEGAGVLTPNNDIFVMFGDTRTEWWNSVALRWDSCEAIAESSANGSLTGGTNLNLGIKGMLLIHNVGGAAPDQHACNALGGLDDALTAGGSPTINYANCWTPIPITTSATRTGTCKTKLATVIVNGLPTDADGYTIHVDAGHIPNAVFILPNGHLYVEWVVSRGNSQFGMIVGGGGSFMTAILADCGLYTAITDVMASDLNCTYLYQFSQGAKAIGGGTGGNSAAVGTCTSGSQTITTTTSLFDSRMTTGTGGTGTVNLEWQDVTNQFATLITGYTDANHVTISPCDTAGAGTNVAWSVMQNQETNVGKFERASIRVFPAATRANWNWGLPAALQSAASVMCTWSASSWWRQSNAYLFCMDSTLVGGSSYSYDSARSYGSVGGINNAWYYTGKDTHGIPTWSQGHEELAAPLLTTYTHTCQSKFISVGNEACFNLGELSVDYTPVGFEMQYGSAETAGLWFRTADAPWGPWTKETQMLTNSGNLAAGGWTAKLGNQGAYNPNVGTPVNAPIACAGCSGSIATNLRYEGGVLVDATTDNGGGHAYTPYHYQVNPILPNGNVDILFHIAMFNWYGIIDSKVELYKFNRASAVDSASAGSVF